MIMVENFVTTNVIINILLLKAIFYQSPPLKLILPAVSELIEEKKTSLNLSNLSFKFQLKNMAAKF